MGFGEFIIELLSLIVNTIICGILIYILYKYLDFKYFSKDIYEKDKKDLEHKVKTFWEK